MPSSKSKPVGGWSSPRAPSVAQSPNFHPPSYYAAANGIPYPPTPRQDHVPSSPAGSRKNHLTTQYEPFMPISYLPDPSSSDSSFEFRPSRKPSGNGSSITESATRGKRQSQIVDLPQIEAQLLPSLRDTIDKMTRPPSYTGPPTSILPGDNALHVSQHLRQENSTDQSSNPFDFSSNAHESAARRRPGVPLSPSKPGSSVKSIRSPASKPTPFKPACSVSAPLSKECRKQEPSRTRVNSRTANTGAPTLRTVKSILTRKLSMNSSTTTPPFKTPKQSNPKTTQESPRTPKASKSGYSHSPFSSNNCRQAASYLDPYPVYYKHSPVEVKPDCQQNPTPPRRLQQSLRSNIPRLRARFAPSPERSQASDSSDSDHRSRHDRARDRGRLFTTNADVPPSSSSEGDGDNVLLLPNSNHPGQRIGLGLSCHSSTARRPRFQVDEDDAQLKSEVPFHKSPRSSVTSSASSDSQYSTASDDQELLPRRSVNEEAQRRAALLSLVSTLDRKPQRRVTQSSESSEYHGEQGVAYSASGELQRTTGPSWFRTPASPTVTAAASNVPASPIDSTPKQHRYRRRSHYTPSPLPLSIPDNSHVNHKDRSGNQANDDISEIAARLTRQSIMAATKEREAFGLKPSDSEVFHQRFENFRQHLRCGSRFSESSVSDATGNRDEVFSSAASHILESIEAKEGPLVWRNTTKTNDDIPGPPGTAPKSRDCLLSSRQIGQDNPEEIPAATRILQQLLDTEEIFVANMRSCIQTYVLPLRANGSRAWISGVPPQISRFLDWFEDILHLHERLLAILHGPPGDVLLNIMKFLPNLEIYQPYTVRLGEFIQLLRCPAEGGNDFRHFVDLQDRQGRQSGWSLSRYIFEPERRLSEYYHLFSAMLDDTPRQDPQYLLIFGLLRSMEVIVDVMSTVKQEEERHRTLSSLLARFQGTHSIMEIADRKRTLLWHGPLLLRLRTDHDGNSGCPPLACRTRRLSKAITTWNTHSSSSLIDGSEHSTSSVSSISASDGDSRDGSPTQMTTSIAVYAVVLSDLVLFGTCSLGASSLDTSGPYRLIDGIGKARVFTVHEIDPSNAFLEVIPTDSMDSTPVTSRIEGLYVSSSNLLPGVSSSEAHLEDCFSALRRSASYTTHLWCVPWKAQKVPQGHDTTQFLTSLVNSGLPLPRSPSGRLPELSSTEGDASIQEREERGWWSFRFHQVMRDKRQMVSNTS